MFTAEDIILEFVEADHQNRRPARLRVGDAVQLTWLDNARKNAPRARRLWIAAAKVRYAVDKELRGARHRLAKFKERQQQKAQSCLST